MGIIHRAGILRGALISSQSSLSASHGRGPQPMSVRTAKPRAASSMGKAHVHPRPGPLGESRHKEALTRLTMMATATKGSMQRPKPPFR